MRTAEAGGSHRRHRICLCVQGRSDPPGSSVSTPRGHECESRVSRRELGGSHEGHRARLPAAPPHWLGTSGAAGAGTPSAAARGVHVSTPRAEPPAACCAPQTRRTDSATALLQGVGRLAVAREACREASCELGVEGEAGPGQAET